MIDPVALELNNRHQTHPGRRDLVQAIVKQSYCSRRRQARLKGYKSHATWNSS